MKGKNSNSIQEEEIRGNTISFLNGLVLPTVLVKENIINPVVLNNIENTDILNSIKVSINLNYILKSKT